MNKRDIVTRALRRLNVVGLGDAPDGEQYQEALQALEQVFADVNGNWGGCTLPFTIDQTFPAAYRFPMIQLLAARLAREYERAEPEPEKTALMRVRAVNLVYTRDMDLDENGITEDEEVDAVDMSRYY